MLTAHYVDIKKGDDMSINRKPPANNVRRVRSFGGNLCGVITNKCNRIVQFESYAERSLLLGLERDQCVKDYSSQPETFVGSDSGGKVKRYTPDFIVWYTDGRVAIHEVTRSERRDIPQQQMREQLAREICNDRGWDYVVHTEMTLPSEREVTNWLVIYPYRARGYDQVNLYEEIRQVKQAIIMGELVSRIKDQVQVADEKIWNTLCHYLWWDILKTDWDQLIVKKGCGEWICEVWHEGEVCCHE